MKSYFFITAKNATHPEIVSALLIGRRAFPGAIEA
jgi:hypothetical protein